MPTSVENTTHDVELLTPQEIVKMRGKIDFDALCCGSHIPPARTEFDVRRIVKTLETMQAEREAVFPALVRFMEIAREQRTEIGELYETIKVIEHEVAEVYCHITSNRFSKPNTAAAWIIGEHDRAVSAAYAEGKADAEK